MRIDGEVVDLQDNSSNSINTNESKETSTKSQALPDASAAASVASENVPQSSKFCSECGARISSKAEVCPKCGVRSTTSGTDGHNRTTAAVLALVLGGIGAHKFYLGKTGMGLVYLAFCWTTVPLWISLVEGIQFLKMSDSEFAMRFR